MSRLVFSFSVPEESEAAALLRQWKREGKTLSHVIQTAIEFGARDYIRLQEDLESETRAAAKAEEILKEIFGVCIGDFRFFPPEHPSQGLKLVSGVNQPIQTLRAARDGLKKRSEWVLNGGWDE